MFISHERDANDLHMVQLMSLSQYHTVVCFIKIQNGLTFLVLAYPGCPGKVAVKWLSVCLWCFYTYITTLFS